MNTLAHLTTSKIFGPDRGFYNNDEHKESATRLGEILTKVISNKNDTASLVLAEFEATEVSTISTYYDVNKLLGDIFFKGDGILPDDKVAGSENPVTKDYVKALNYYEKSAQNGNADSFRMLALMYERGLGVDRDHDSAIKHIKQAILGGSDDALNQMASMKPNRGDQIMIYSLMSKKIPSIQYRHNKDRMQDNLNRLEKTMVSEDIIQAQAA